MHGHKWDNLRTSKVKAEVRVPTTAETVTAKVLPLVLLYGLHVSAVSLLHAAVRQRLELKRMDGVASTVAKFRPMFVTCMHQKSDRRWASTETHNALYHNARAWRIAGVRETDHLPQASTSDMHAPVSTHLKHTGASNEKAPANVPTTAPIDTATYTGKYLCMHSMCKCLACVAAHENFCLWAPVGTALRSLKSMHLSGTHCPGCFQ